MSTETPRTDAELEKPLNDPYCQREGVYVTGDFGRQLERELSTATSLLAEKEKALEEAYKAHRIQQQNYLDLVQAVEGDGTFTAEFRDPRKVAARHREQFTSLLSHAEAMAGQLELALHYIANPKVEGEAVVGLPSAEIVLKSYRTQFPKP